MMLEAMMDTQAFPLRYTFTPPAITMAEQSKLDMAATLKRDGGPMRPKSKPPAEGEQKRQDILRILKAHGPMRVGLITPHMGLSQQAVSYHMKLLLQAERVKFSLVDGLRVYWVTGK